MGRLPAPELASAQSQEVFGSLLRWEPLADAFEDVLVGETCVERADIVAKYGVEESFVRVGLLVQAIGDLCPSVCC